MDDVQTMSRRISAAGTAVAAATGFGGIGPLAWPALGSERLVPRGGSASSCSPSARSRRPTFPERRALADIGYREIEVAGLFGRTPAAVPAAARREPPAGDRRTPAGRSGAHPVLRSP